MFYYRKKRRKLARIGGIFSFLRSRRRYRRGRSNNMTGPCVNLQWWQRKNRPLSFFLKSLPASLPPPSGSFFVQSYYRKIKATAVLWHESLLALGRKEARWKNVLVKWWLLTRPWFLLALISGSTQNLPLCHAWPARPSRPGTQTHLERQWASSFAP